MHLAFDRFAQGDSGIHRMDTRLKLVGFGSFLVATAWVTTWPSAFAALAAAGFWVGYAGFPWAFVVRRIRMPFFFLSSFLMILPFSHPDGPGAGAIQACVILLKGMAMILTIFPMFGTAPLDISMKTLEGLKVSSKFVAMILFTFRYFSVYSDELQTIRHVFRSRGFKPGFDLHSARTVGYLVGSLLVRSLDQTERIYQSMLCRGYRGRMVTLYDFSPIRREDQYRFGLLILISMGLVALDKLI
ncbi:MAG: energy-coupling factor transporter transmembrane component T [bacterium]